MWVQCIGCGLKHSKREDETCPKCGQSVVDAPPATSVRQRRQSSDPRALLFVMGLGVVVLVLIGCLGVMAVAAPRDRAPKTVPPEEISGERAGHWVTVTGTPNARTMAAKGSPVHAAGFQLKETGKWLVVITTPKLTPVLGDSRLWESTGLAALLGAGSGGAPSGKFNRFVSRPSTFTGMLEVRGDESALSVFNRGYGMNAGDVCGTGGMACERRIRVLYVGLEPPGRLLPGIVACVGLIGGIALGFLLLIKRQEWA